MFKEVNRNTIEDPRLVRIGGKAKEATIHQDRFGYSYALVYEDHRVYTTYNFDIIK